MLEVDVQHRAPPLALEFAFRTESTITGVFGRSGAGKTSLLHLIAGLITPTAGSIRLGGELLFHAAERKNVPVRHRRLGLVFQDDRLFPHLSVGGNLQYGARRAGAGDIRTDDVVDLLELGPLTGRPIHGLSGGERQRVALGRALLSAPRLLLLDEPLSSLDRVHRRSILGFIARIRDELGLPMLYVTHDLTELLQLTDRLLLVADGRSVAHGPLHEVVTDTAAWRAVRDLGPLNVLAATVRGHDREAGLTRLEVGGADAAAVSIVAPLTDLPTKRVVHVAIRSGDIALALGPVAGISIQNQIGGRVRRVTTHSDRALVEIDIGARLIAEVSHKTVREMAIAPDRAVHCLVKSNAVRYAD